MRATDMAFYKAFVNVMALLLYSSAVCKLAYAHNPIFDAIQQKLSIQRLDECLCEVRVFDLHMICI